MNVKDIKPVHDFNEVYKFSDQWKLLMKYLIFGLYLLWSFLCFKYFFQKKTTMMDSSINSIQLTPRRSSSMTSPNSSSSDFNESGGEFLDCDNSPRPKFFKSSIFASPNEKNIPLALRSPPPFAECFLTLTWRIWENVITIYTLPIDPMKGHLHQSRRGQDPHLYLLL